MPTPDEQDAISDVMDAADDGGSDFDEDPELAKGIGADPAAPTSPKVAPPPTSPKVAPPRPRGRPTLFGVPLSAVERNRRYREAHGNPKFVQVPADVVEAVREARAELGVSTGDTLSAALLALKREREAERAPQERRPRGTLR
jgi:hypothetical protein